MLRRSARLFDKEVMRLNAIPGKITPRCFPTEIILLIMSTVVEDARNSAHSVRWYIRDDFRGDFCRRGVCRHPNRAEMRLRLLLVRGPLQANKLCRRLVEKTFMRVDILPGDARPNESPIQALVLYDLDIFQEGHELAFIRGQNRPRFTIPRRIPTPLSNFIRHLEMNPVHFRKALSLRFSLTQPEESLGQSLASLKSLEYIVLTSPGVDLIHRHNGGNIPIPVWLHDMNLMSREFGLSFGTLWKPFQERGVRIFVSRPPFHRGDSRFRAVFELVAANRGGMMLREL